jgi:hypothetical protein
LSLFRKQKRISLRNYNEFINHAKSRWQRYER